MEIRATVDEKFMKELQESLKKNKVTDVTRDALTLLNWAVKEVKSGRVILSADENGNNVHRLAMPGLDNAKP